MNSKFSKLVENLELQVQLNETNTRLVHKIKSYSLVFPSSFSDEVSRLVTQYDEWVDAEVPGNALIEMTRLLGMLEGQLAVVEEQSLSVTADLGDLVPKFSLNENDRARVLKLCGGMREIVQATSEFDHPHKIRLLNRIASIEAEVHKEKGMFDIILGGVSDVGETLGKFGKDVKPLTDRMNEILDITRRGTKEYDQLPPPEEIKRLPAPEPSEDE